MKVYVRIDLWGVAGVVHAEQGRRGGPDYEEARRWMTGEANAAVAGAFEAGAEAVVVRDGHGDQRNLVLEDVDPRADVVTGEVARSGGAAGAEAGFGVALLVGQSAAAGTLDAVLASSGPGGVISKVLVHEAEIDEVAVCAAVLGARGVPVGLVAGDAAVCGAASKRLGEVETVVVKQGLGRSAARHLHPRRARQQIREAACRAVARARVQAFAPYRPDPPLDLQVTFADPGCADAAGLVPGSRRLDGVRLGYDARDAETLHRVLRAWAILAASTRR